MISNDPQLTPLPCDGIALLEVEYPKVKVLINSSKAKIFPPKIEHADAADSKSSNSSSGIWYDTVNGNCLAGYIYFASKNSPEGQSAKIHLRTTSNFPVADTSAVNWCRRLFSNKILLGFTITEIKLADRTLFKL